MVNTNFFGVLDIASSIILIPAIFYFILLQKTLLKCSSGNREMKPGLVWLWFIPVFGQAWLYYIVLKLSKSMNNEFISRGINADVKKSTNIGLYMASANVAELLALSFSSVLGVILMCVTTLLWIVHWKMIYTLSSKLN